MSGRDDGRVWGRAEATDTLIRIPGRRGRAAVRLLGLLAVVVGGYLAVSEAPGAPPALASQRTGGNDSITTCASVGIELARGRVPAEGVPESSVVRLLRTDADGSVHTLVPQAYVLKSVSGPGDGSTTLSVVIRSGAADTLIADVTRANTDRTLSAAVLYDVDPRRVLDDCRR